MKFFPKQKSFLTYRPQIKYPEMHSLSAGLNYCAKEFLLFFYNPHDNSVRMMNEYLNKSAMLFGRIDRLGFVTVSGSKLLYMSLLGFFSFLEIIKEFLFITNLVGYDSVVRYLFIDCSMLFPSMRYFYVILHATLSLPFCCIFVFFWYENVKYYFGTRRRDAQLSSLIETTSERPNRPPNEILKKFNFRFLAFLMYGSAEKAAHDYQVRRKYLDAMFKVTNSSQSCFYPM